MIRGMSYPRGQALYQLTVRGLDAELADSIRRLARKERISLNQAVLRLLRRGAGLADDQGSLDTVGSSLDGFIGSWTRQHADEMDRALQDFEGIEESLGGMRIIGTQKFTIEIEQEQDQSWIAEVIEMPGVMAYAGSPDAAKAKVQALALRVVADRLEHGELITEFLNIAFDAA